MGYQLRNALIIWFLSVTLMACSKGFQGGSEALPSSGNEVTQAPQISPEPETIFKFQPLLWEVSKPANKSWSDYTYEVINSQAPSLLIANDMSRFCPNYNSLGSSQKLNAVGMLISAIVRFESNFNPLTRYLETTLGTDPITGQPVYSEGLMQLSYQDITGWPFCEFDWEKDKHLAPTDPNKTILDPYKNLNCGIRILAQQIQRKGKIVLGTGAYWAVIKEGGRYEKIDEIATLVSSLEFCRL